MLRVGYAAHVVLDHVSFVRAAPHVRVCVCVCVSHPIKISSASVVLCNSNSHV